jgi:hypothetical protein
MTRNTPPGVTHIKRTKSLRDMQQHQIKSELPRGFRPEMFPQNEQEMFQRIGTRGAMVTKKLREQFPMSDSLPDHPIVIALDVAVAHWCRNLRLRDMLQAEELAFMADLTSIEKNIVRERNFLHADVRLRFAQSGAIITL